MKTLRMLVVLTVTVLIAFGTVWAADAGSDDKNLGEKLVKQLWSELKANAVAAGEKWLAKGFQSAHDDGGRDLAQQMKLLEKLKLGNYKLTDIKITRNGPVIVATYFVSVTETIDGKKLNSTPAARLTVFLKTDKGWKWQAHANLKALK